MTISVAFYHKDDPNGNGLWDASRHYELWQDPYLRTHLCFSHPDWFAEPLPERFFAELRESIIQRGARGCNVSVDKRTLSRAQEDNKLPELVALCRRGTHLTDELVSRILQLPERSDREKERKAKLVTGALFAQAQWGRDARVEVSF